MRLNLIIAFAASRQVVRMAPSYVRLARLTAPVISAYD